MVIKSVPMDDQSVIVFAIRGTSTFMDWAVNLNTEPTAPVGFLVSHSPTGPGDSRRDASANKNRMTPGTYATQASSLPRRACSRPSPPASASS